MTHFSRLNEIYFVKITRGFGRAPRRRGRGENQYGAGGDCVHALKACLGIELPYSIGNTVIRYFFIEKERK